MCHLIGRKPPKLSRTACVISYVHFTLGMHAKSKFGGDATHNGRARRVKSPAARDITQGQRSTQHGRRRLASASLHLPGLFRILGLSPLCSYGSVLASFVLGCWREGDRGRLREAEGRIRDRTSAAPLHQKTKYHILLETTACFSFRDRRVQTQAGHRVRFCRAPTFCCFGQRK